MHVTFLAQFLLQMDAMLDSSRELKEKEAENEALRCENDELRSRLQDLQTELDEYKLYNREQQEQLSFFRQRTAQSRLEADKFKVENMVLNTGNVSLEAHTQLLEDQRQLRQDMQAMQRKCREAQAAIDQLQADNSALCARLKAQKIADEDTADPRTKRELLRVIRRAKEEKGNWEQYAEHLLRQIVTQAPQVLEIRLRADVEHCCREEARWEAFSLSLVQTVMERQPQLLETVRTPTETDHEKLAHSRRSKVVSVV